jgi:acyl-CoA dehydrogenase
MSGRLLTMHAAWLIDQGERAQKEVSMAKIEVADILHRAADTAVQLTGARGYSKDTVLEWIYRYARCAKLVDGASEVHQMVLARHYEARQRFLEVGGLRDMTASPPCHPPASRRRDRGTQ